MAVQINTDVMKKYNPDYDPTKPVGVSGVIGTQSSAETASAYNKKAQAEGRQDWQNAYRTDVLKLPTESAPTTQIDTTTQPTTQPTQPVKTTTPPIETASGLSEKPTTQKITQPTTPINYNVGTGRENEINANLSEGYKNDIGIKKSVDTGDYTAFKQAYNYDTADQTKKQLLDFFFQSRQPKSSDDIFNSLIAGQTGYSQDLKNTDNYRAAEKRYNDYNTFKDYTADKFSPLLSNGYLLPGSALYNDLSKDPKAKAELDKAQTLNAINKVKIDDENAQKNVVNSIVENTPLGKALADGYITAEEANQLTTTPQIEAKQSEANRYLDDYTKQKNIYDNIALNTENELKGKGATRTEINALIASRQRDLLPQLQLSQSLYNNALGNIATMKEAQANLFNTNLKLYQDRLTARQEAQKLADERQYARGVLTEQRDYDEQKSRKQLLEKEGDINSTDPYIKQKAITNAVDQVLKTYKDIPMVRSREQMISDITNAVNAGQDLGQAISQNIIAPIQNKPEYKAKIAEDKAKGIKYETYGGKVYKIENGVLTDTGISAIEPEKSQFTTIGQDENGNNVYGFVNPQTRAVTQYGGTSTTSDTTSTTADSKSTIAGFEGFRDKAYWDVNGWAIGYGQHSINGNPVKEGDTITRTQADADMNTRLANQSWKPLVKVPLSSSQEAALSSFEWNLGSGIWKKSASSIIAKINAGDFTGAANEMLQYNHAGGKVNKGLTDRRQQEANLLKATGKTSTTGTYNEANAAQYNRYIKNGILPTGIKDGSKKAEKFKNEALNYKDAQDKKDQESGKWASGLNDTEYKRVNDIIDKLSTDPVTKTFKKTQEAYNFAKNVSAGDSATDNQALIYAFAKAMDPDSVVREGEYSTVQKYSQTWGDQLGMNINRILNGQEFISAKAKQNMVNTIKSKYEASKQSYEALRANKIKQINDIAQKDIGEKAIPSDVIGTQKTTTPKTKTNTKVQQNISKYFK